MCSLVVLCWTFSSAPASGWPVSLSWKVRLLKTSCTMPSEMISTSMGSGYVRPVYLSDTFLTQSQIEVAWNDRQFILPHHVAQKIRLGATRNITVHNVTPAVTADSLREDLDHIHNLVVVNTKFEHGNAYISLNSIHNSLFARTCMRSRLKFKGMLIDWYPDECARPLPRIAYVPKKENVQPVKKLNPMANRFQLLNMDGTEDGSEDEEEELTETSYTSVGLKNSWTDRSIAV
jgi:hypothetical protein